MAKAAPAPCTPPKSSRSSGERWRAIGEHAIGRSLRQSNARRRVAPMLGSNGKGSEHQMLLVAIGARLRAICLALPEATGELMRRGPSYRVANKIFALERPRDDGLALWCKVPDGSREIMLEAEPARFFFPPILAPRAGSASDWTQRPTGVKSRPSHAVAIGSLRQSGSPRWWREPNFMGLIASARRTVIASRPKALF
jgi:hypothetical protein